jgi:hypothetical protein
MILFADKIFIMSQKIQNKYFGNYNFIKDFVSSSTHSEKFLSDGISIKSELKLELPEQEVSE